MASTTVSTVYPMSSNSMTLNNLHLPDYQLVACSAVTGRETMTRSSYDASVWVACVRLNWTTLTSASVASPRQMPVIW